MLARSFKGIHTPHYSFQHAQTSSSQRFLNRGTFLTNQSGQYHSCSLSSLVASRPPILSRASPKPPINNPQANQRVYRHSFHHIASLNTSFIGRWLSRGRGMRRRIGAWADSLGVTSGHPSRNDGSRTPEESREGEELFVMPGWAVVKYREDVKTEAGAPAPFDLHVSVSGFCSEARSPSAVSRTQRVIVSVVRRFAALPNLPGMNPEDQPLGPLPAAVGMAFLEQAAEDDGEDRGSKAAPSQSQFQNLPYAARKKRTPTSTPIVPTEPTSESSTSQPSSANSVRPTPSRQSSISSTDTAFTDKASIRTAHQNLNARLAPFWSSVLPSRRVLFDIYAAPPTSGSDPLETGKIDDEPLYEGAPDQDPLHSFEFYTDSNGHFSQIVVIPWEKLCTTPSTVEAVYSSVGGKEKDESNATSPLIGWKLRLRSRLDYEVLPVAENDMSYRQRIRRAVSSYGVDANDVPASRPTAEGAAAAKEALEKLSLNTPGEPQVIEWTTIRVGSAAGVHIISDLDDTVKHSDILAGPREVFRNVFCRPLDEILVPEMDSMYRRFESRGVAGFHFVSNSPSQLFPSIRQFLTTNSFPPRHSIKLNYYGGRSIFSSLYDSPAERKRSSLHELFRAFPTANFMMFGDSAEQDLELYMEFAKLWPERVAAVAIRDVTSDRAAEVYKEAEKAGMKLDGNVSLSASSSTASLVLSEEPADLTSTSASASAAPSAASTGTASGTATIPPQSEQPPPSPALHMPGELPPTRPSPMLRTNSSASLLSDEDVRSLSSSQQKILQRAITWEARMGKARREKPEKMVLLFYKDPLEVEEKLGGVIDRLKV